MNKPLKTVYAVQSLEVDGDCSTDYTVGVCLSKKTAKNICKRLQAENDKICKFWKKYGVNCTVGMCAWESDTDEDAIKTLKLAKLFKCPLAKNIKLSEIFYSVTSKNVSKNVSGGFEITCDGHHDGCVCPTQVKYVVKELEVLDENKK